MKFSTLLMIALSAVIALPLRAVAEGGEQREYLEIYSPGKSWKYATFNVADEEIFGYKTKTVVGDTVIDGKVCRKVAVGKPQIDSNVFKGEVIYEENGKVFVVSKNEATGENVFTLIMDISAQEGDSFNDGWFPIGGVDEIMVNGIKRKRLGYGSLPRTTCWVEGIGYATEWDLLPLVETNSNTTVMIECSQDGEVIFTKDDFKLLPEGYEYRPMVVEGRTWWYSYTPLDADNGNSTGYCGITIGDVTELDGVKWHLCYFIDENNELSGSPLCYLREEDRQIHFLAGPAYSDAYPFSYSNYAAWNNLQLENYLEKGWIIYDFNLGMYDTFYGLHNIEPMMISKIDYIRQENGTFKIRQMREHKVIEGVGLTSEGYMFCSPFAPITAHTPHPQPTLLWVTEGADNEVYYEGAGGEQPWKTQGVASAVAGGDGEVVSIVDLSGRRVDRPAAGIYIVTTRNADGTLTSRKVAIK